MYLHRDMYLSSSHTLKHLIDQSSGSGSGLPLLVSIDIINYNLGKLLHFNHLIIANHRPDKNNGEPICVCVHNGIATILLWKTTVNV